LANDIGNLFSRSMAMLHKYSGGRVPAPAVMEAGDRLLQQTIEQMLPVYHEAMANFQFHRALQAIWEVIGSANRYIVTNEPWALAKDPGQIGRLHSVLYNLAECLRLLAMVLGPIMPAAAEKMAVGLGLAADHGLIADLSESGSWGLLPPGTELRPIEPLFPRMEKGKVKEVAETVTMQAKAKEDGDAAGQGVISFGQFQEVDLRVAEIVAAEQVKKSDKLLKLTVMAPEERTIVAGIAEYYRPEELVGRLVLVVANLKPAKLMGIASQGMVLAAKTVVDGKERLVLSTVSEPVPAGSKVS
jgi:methionyl-tRNA synthetase